MNKLNIAIDGPCGSGKGITSKLLAKKLNYSHLDTGAMYRAIGYILHTKYGFNKYNFNSKILNKVKFEFNFDKNNNIILNGVNLENQIRTSLGGQLASDFSTIPQIRQFLVKIQKQMVINRGFIAEGRDICEVVMPDAELKIYLTASENMRARRRFEQYLKDGKICTFEEVLKEIQYRDKQDSTRENSPLVKSKNSIELDTSNLTIDEQVNKIYFLAVRLLQNN